MNVCIGDEVHARCSGRFSEGRIHYDTHTLIAYFCHFYLPLKPLSDGIVYRGTVTQVDDIRKEVEVKALGSYFKSYHHF